MDHDRFPKTSRDYPQTWSEFLDRFHSEDACLCYLEKIRWPSGFVCPRCGVVDDAYRATRSRLVCSACQYQCSVTAGTIFDKTRMPLRVWFSAAWYITSQKHGVSALGMKRVLGLGSYQTAWAMLHRFRKAMVNPGREKLRGTVEVDESFIAIADKEAKRKKEYGWSSKVCVIIGIEKMEPKGFGRIRLQLTEKATKNSLQAFIRDNIEPGSVISTDGATFYADATNHGYIHEPTVVSGSDIAAHVSLPGVHRVAALLKRWLLGTHHGAIKPKHLDAYLNEFVFRFNRRTSRSRGLLFYRLLEQAVKCEPVTYCSITIGVTQEK